MIGLISFIEFSPLTGSGKDLPKTPGNYLVIIRDIKAMPTLGHTIVTQLFQGQEIIYTGIAKKNLSQRIWRSHIKGHAGKSTLRLTLGCLFGYLPIPRDKNNPKSRKVKFNADDENKLSEWIKENLVFYYVPNDFPKKLETDLIEMYNPPLNLDENDNPVNKELRDDLSERRNVRPWIK